MDYITTAKDLRRFKKHFIAMIDKLGVSGWRITFYLQEMDAAATCEINLEARDVFVNLNTRFGSKPLKGHLKSYAEHEALELLMARLFVNSCQRFVSEAEMTEARHEVIQTLLPLLRIAIT